MKGRNPTAKEKHWMDSVNQLGCIACYNLGIDTPPDYTLIHHTDGKTKPGAHFKVLPLCDPHHSRYQKTGLHYNKAQWECIHGTEEQLLEQVSDMINEAAAEQESGIPDGYAEP